MTDPIDRALERLFRSPVIMDSFDAFKSVNLPILNDLAAERYAEGVMAPCRCEAKARLAAVGAWRDRNTRMDQHDSRHWDELDAILDGEGGEQVRVGGVDPDPQHTEPGFDDAQAGSAKIKEQPASAEPAAPDAPQITMHAYEADTYGECKHCGYGPEHPRHGARGKEAEDR